MVDYTQAIATLWTIAITACLLAILGKPRLPFWNGALPEDVLRFWRVVAVTTLSIMILVLIWQ